MQMRVRREPAGTPETCRQAREQGRIQIQKALDGRRGTKDPGEEAGGIIFCPRRRQPALKQAGGNFPKNCMLGRNARFRKEGNRIERAQG